MTNELFYTFEDYLLQQLEDEEWEREWDIIPDNQEFKREHFSPLTIMPNVLNNKI
jgi:hypothetical protein